MQQRVSNKKVRQVPCPHCKTLSEFSPQNPYRPFCSERCKILDFGDWANENYRIPDKTPPKNLDDIN
jgi:endogenous inhibitor of DNA gyrase (YacG/DUF329 family)